MNAQIQAKTRIQERDLADFRRPDKKKDAGGLAELVAGDALNVLIHGST
jgi:hypothetical protein